MKEFVIEVMFFRSTCLFDFAMGVVSWSSVCAGVNAAIKLINLYAIY